MNLQVFPFCILERLRIQISISIDDLDNLCCDEIETEDDVFPEYEIDSIQDDVFGELFRVWKGFHFVGSFYQLKSGRWISQPLDVTVTGSFINEKQAILLIIAFTENPEMKVCKPNSCC